MPPCLLFRVPDSWHTCHLLERFAQRPGRTSSEQGEVCVCRDGGARHSTAAYHPPGRSRRGELVRAVSEKPIQNCGRAHPGGAGEVSNRSICRSQPSPWFPALCSDLCTCGGNGSECHGGISRGPTEAHEGGLLPGHFRSAKDWRRPPTVRRVLGTVPQRSRVRRVLEHTELLGRRCAELEGVARARMVWVYHPRGGARLLQGERNVCGLGCCSAGPGNGDGVGRRFAAASRKADCNAQACEEQQSSRQPLTPTPGDQEHAGECERRERFACAFQLGLCCRCLDRQHRGGSACPGGDGGRGKAGRGTGRQAGHRQGDNPVERSSLRHRRDGVGGAASAQNRLAGRVRAEGEGGCSLPGQRDGLWRFRVVIRDDKAGAEATRGGRRKGDGYCAGSSCCQAGAAGAGLGERGRAGAGQGD